MRSIITMIATSFLLIAVVQVHAKGGSQYLWLVIPYASVISNCSKHGANMRQRLTDALAKGKENTKEVVPDSVWGILEAANSSTENIDISPNVENACEAIIEMYQNPKYATYFRQAIAAQLVSSPALICIIKQATMSSEIKEAWLKAFHRNGFELSEDAMNTGIENARSYIENQAPKEGPSISECKKVISLFSTENFDTKFSESGVYNLFSSQKK